MNALPIGGPTPVSRKLIEDAIRENGALRVLIAAALAIVRARPRRPARPPDVSELNTHLRRDIGLPPEPRARLWETYLR